MSYGVPSDEVAEDYVQALQSLTMNSRYEISNLTVIAKENTEHALAISEALRLHIKQISPQKKLPAFYVLDSVVKNVGTPYTLFFGRQLYSTFMEAYVLVDNSTRRKMEEMLKTWKEPVPGSIDTRPVFPPDVTRPIENALIKARTSAVQAQQEQLRSQQQFMGRGRPLSATPYRETPTPPAQHPMQPMLQNPLAYGSNLGQQQYPPPVVPQTYPNQMNGQQSHGLPPRPTSQQYSPPIVQQYSQHPNQQYQHPAQNQQFPQQSSNQQYSQQTPNQQYPYSGATEQWPQQYPQTTQQFPQQTPIQQYSPQPHSSQYSQQGAIAPSWQPQQAPQLQGYQAPDNSLGTLTIDIANLIDLTKSQFAQNVGDQSIATRLKALLDLQKILSNQRLPPDQIALIRAQVTQLSEAAQPARVPSPSTYSPPPATAALPTAPVQAAAAKPNINALFPGLAALLARQSATPQPIPPPQIARIQSPPIITQPTKLPASSKPVPDPSSLLERLRAAGMLGSTTSTPPLPLGSLIGKVPPGFPPPTFTPPVSRTPLAEIPNDVVLKSSSLKMFRPHLISSLYERLGAPCTTCGRRFRTDEEGKKKKAAHMDWHFMVNHGMSEAQSRGQHRSWYVDELEWIKSRSNDQEAKSTDATNGSGGFATASPTKPKLQYVTADSANSDKVCPICQEKFEMTWQDDLQEFVWLDAKEIGGRVYHASCHAEAFKDSLASMAKRGTPEPLLGKRKAEEEHIAVRPKIKTESEF